MNDIYRILLVSALSALVIAQLSGPGTYCLGNCAFCDSKSLFSCIGSTPCQQFYEANAQGVCKITPSLQISYQDFGKQPVTETSLLRWGSDSKLTKCSYENIEINQQIEILGLYQGQVSIQRQFQTIKGDQLVEIRFSLVRNDWVPFNDFLALELVSASQIINTYQISYQQRSNITSFGINFICDGNRLLIERYKIKIQPGILKNIKDSTFKLVFNSFMFQGSVWGLTDIKIITGCIGFSKFDSKKSQCASCDTGYYMITSGERFGACKSCQDLCKTCKSEENCLQCRWGNLSNGKCVAPQTYKSQQVAKDYFSSTCGSYALQMSSNQNKIVFPVFQNIQNSLYDEVVTLVIGYYDPLQISLGDKKDAEISLILNDQKINSVDLKKENLELVESCKLFASQRMAKIVFVGPLTTINDNKLNIRLEASGITTFGVSKAFIFSPKKDQIQQHSSQAANKNSYFQTKAASNIGSKLPPSTAKQNHQEDTSSLLLNSKGYQKTKDINIVNQIAVKQMGLATLSNKTHSITSNNGSILFSIFGIGNKINGKIKVQIDQLQPQDYELIDTYYFEENLMIEVKVSKSFKKGKVSFRQVQLSPRLLQEITLKLISTTIIQRYDAVSPSQLQSFISLEKTFQAFAWFGMIAIIIAVISGFGVIIEEYIVTLQLIYLHIYVGYSLLPLSFTHTVCGLRGATLLDFFNPFVVNVSPWSINSQLLFKLLPSSFHFFYAFLPILLTLISYSLWFLGLIAIKKWLLPRDIPDQSRGALHKRIDGVVCRIINYIDTIWRYQFIGVVLICLKQCFSFQEDGHSGQLTLAGSVFATYLLWSAFSEYYIRQQYYQCEYSYFLFKFQDRFFCRIPQHSLPSRHHRLGYPLVRIGKGLVFALLTFFNQPVVVLIIMILINGFELKYVFSNIIYSDSRMLKFKLVQGAFFLALQLLMLVLVIAQKQISSPQFIGWGFFLATISILIVINGLIRVIFAGWLKYMQMKDVSFEEVELDQKKLKTERAV